MPNYHMLESVAPKLEYTIQELDDAIETGTVLRGRVIAVDTLSNLYIHLNNETKGFMLFEDCTMPMGKPVPFHHASSRVGTVICFKVMYKDENRVYHLSRLEAQRDYLDSFMKTTQLGDIVSCQIIRILDKALLVDFCGGIVGLIPKNEVQVCTVVKLKYIYKPGDILKAYTKKMLPGNFILGQQRLFGTWRENADSFNCGDKVIGEVFSKTSYGVFVSLAPNLCGLMPPRNDVSIGDKVVVSINTVNYQTHKVKLNFVKIVATKGYFETSRKYYLTSGNTEHWVHK